MKFLPLLAAALLTACAANPATGGHNFSLVTPGEERSLGEAAAEQTLRADGLYRPESNATKYVDALCNKVYAATEAAADPVQCNLMDNGDFNAYATPGYLMVNRGLLPFISSEAELAAVLGHESGHLNARHLNSQLTRERMATILLAGGAAAVAVQSNNAGTTQAAIAAGSVGASLGLLAYTRSQETEADTLGRRYMENAGYEPREAVNMVHAMEMYDDYQRHQQAAFNNGQIAPVSLLDHLKSSHPGTPERLAATISATGLPQPISPTADLGRQRYMQAIEGLTFGPARRYGIARKAELVLTAQRTIIPLPADTTTAYIGSGNHDNLGTWLIAHPQSGAYVTVNAVKLTPGHNPGTLLQNMLPWFHESVQRMQLGQGEHTTIGYTATYHYLNNAKRFRALTFASPERPEDMLLLTVIYPSQAVFDREDANLMSVLKPMTFITEDKSATYKQLQINTFTAAIGDSVARQSSKLPVGTMQEDLFRALNNLPAPAELTPGQFYKTVVDLNN